MILLKPQATNRFTIIPREYVTTAFMTIRDDSTNNTKEHTLGLLNISISNDSYKIQNLILNLVEGHFYDLTLYSDAEKTKLIYKDRIFCTIQELNQLENQYYKINKDQYTTYDGNNNDYIVIWEKKTKRDNL